MHPDDATALVPVFVPALVTILLEAERSKGEPLTRDEVVTLRDTAAAIMLPAATATSMAAARGYDDLDPERVWEQWQQAREIFADES